MTSEDLRELWTAVWAFRAEMEDYFPTPPRDDALAFAYTEGVGEALAAQHGWHDDDLDAAAIFASRLVDAQLIQNPRYKRNNPDKSHSLERELTQCAMMLLTAVPRTWNGWNWADVPVYVSTWTVRNIAISVGKCLEMPSDIEYILGTVAAINTAVNLHAELFMELNRMRAKHKPANNTNGGAIAYVPKAERLVIDDYTEGSGVE